MFQLSQQQPRDQGVRRTKRINTAMPPSLTGPKMWANITRHAAIPSDGVESREVRTFPKQRTSALFKPEVFSSLIPRDGGGKENCWWVSLGSCTHDSGCPSGKTEVWTRKTNANFKLPRSRAP